MGELGRSVFTGPGAVVIQLMFLAIGTFIAEFVATAIGKGQYSRLIVVAGLFSGFVIVLMTIGKALAEAGKVMGF